MPIFKVRLEREYVNREVLDIMVEADTEEAAKAEALALAEEDEDGNYEFEWSEIDGGPGGAEVSSITKIAETNDVIETS